jgi:hypothetical protein
MGEMLFAVRMEEDAEYLTIFDLFDDENHHKAYRAYRAHENSILVSEPGKL